MIVSPSWLEVATTYLGTQEVVGKGSNPKILAMVARVAVGPFKWIKSFFTDDDIPWCALFVNSCLAEAGVSGTGSLAARSFEAYGRQLVAPRYGCILVFKRKGGGHVGFYVGETADGKLLRVRGGNQNNSVNDTWIQRDRLTSMRWPAGPDLPVSEPVVLSDDGQPVSVDEG
jgi:uncharacterized protein (TIGR02594 family)